MIGEGLLELARAWATVQQIALEEGGTAWDFPNRGLTTETAARTLEALSPEARDLARRLEPLVDRRDTMES